MRGLSATGFVSWSRRVRAGEVLCCDCRQRVAWVCGSTKDVTELATGTVKFFNAEKGCGFISRGEDDDAAIADERNALLRDDLNAAQLRTARALAETHARSPRRRLVR